METTVNDHGLSSIGACCEAKEFAAKYESLQAAWEACDNPKWMLWLLLRTAGEWGSESHRRAVGVMIECVRPAMQYVPAGETRPQAATDLLSRYARGEAVDRDAARAASDAAGDAARADSDAAWADSDSAWAAARAASDAAWAAAKQAMVATIRRLVPAAPEIVR